MSFLEPNYLEFVNFQTVNDIYKTKKDEKQKMHKV